MKPKTKPEAKVQFKMSIPKSIAEAFDTHRKEGDQLGFDWTATMLEPMLKTDAEFSQFLAQHRAKVQPEVKLTPLDRISTTNGAEPDRD
jgi:hypothetical protein